MGPARSRWSGSDRQIRSRDRCLNTEAGSSTKPSGPNVTVKVSRKPVCPRITAVPWCGHGSSTATMPRQPIGVASTTCAGGRTSNVRSYRATSFGRATQPQPHGLVAYDRIAVRLQHFDSDDGDRAAGVDDRGEAVRGSGCGDADDGAEHGPWAASVPFSEVGVAVVPGVSQARRPPARPVREPASLPPRRDRRW